jgi:hypothetical protein
MRALPFVKALSPSPSQRDAGIAMVCALAALLLASLAPIAGLLLLTVLAAAALMTRRTPMRWRPDAFAWGGLIVAAAAAGAAGAPGLVGCLFCWLLADSARAAIRRSAAMSGAGPHPLSERLPLLLVAAFAGLLVAASAPHVVLGLPLDLPHPPSGLMTIFGVAYALAAVDWIVRILARWRLGENRPAPVAFDASFHVVILAGFVLSPDVSAGVIALVAYRMALAIDRKAKALAAV